MSQTTAKRRLFISYARRDGRDLALKLQAALNALEFEAWLDTAEIDGGAVWSSDIEGAIDGCEAMLALLSHGSYTSEICRGEHNRALRLRKRVIPLLVQPDADRPIYLEGRNYRDFSDPVNFDAVFALLLNDLRSGVDTPAVVAQETKVIAPPLPAHYVPRPEALDRLRSAVLSDTTDRQIALSALHGMGGIGKTTLATALCHDEAIHDAFPDGVIWVDIGQKPGDLVEKIRIIGQGLGDLPSHYATFDTAQARLREVLPTKAALIILDDVWEAAHARPFLVDAPRVRVLVTTRNREISLALGATDVRLDVMTRPESVALLRAWAGKTDPAFSQIADELGDHPLAVKLAAARLRDGVSGEDWLTNYNSVSRLKLGRRPQTAQESVELSFDLSVNDLPEDDRPLYHTLAVFPEDNWIPETVVIRLWRAIEPDLDAADALDLILALERAALLERDMTAHAIHLHDLLHSYNRERLGDRYADMQAALLRAYNPNGAAWWEVSDDGYFYRFIAYHLIEARQVDALSALLLDFRWLQAKLKVTDANALLSDLDSVIVLPSAAIADDVLYALRLVRSALSMSAHVLAEDKTQLAAQLTGRLYMQREQPEINRLFAAVTPPTPGLFPALASASHEQAGGALLRVLIGHDRAINQVAFSPDGAQLASAAGEGAIHLWDIQTGQLLVTIPPVGAMIRVLAYSPDGATLAGGSSDGVARTWEVKTGRLLTTFSGQKDAIESLAFSPDGKALAIGSRDKTVCLWDAETGELKNTLHGHTDWVLTIAFSPDGMLIATGSSDGTIRLWGKSGVALDVTLNPSVAWVQTLKFSLDGATLISISADTTVIRWDARTWQPVRLPDRQPNWALASALSVDGRFIASSTDDGAVYLHEAASGELIMMMKGHEAWVLSLAISPQGDKVASGSSDRTVRLWDVHVHTGSATAQLRWDGVPPEVRHVEFAPSGDFLAVGSTDRLIHLYDASSFNEIDAFAGHENSVRVVAFSPDGALLASGSSDKSVRVWDSSTRQPKYLMRAHDASTRAVCFSPDGTILASAGSDRAIRFWAVATGEEIALMMGHDDGITSLAFSPDGTLLASGSYDKTVRLWNVYDRSVMATLPGHEGYVLDLAFSPDGQAIVSASNDHTLRIWDIRQGQHIRIIRGHNHMVNAVTFSPDGGLLASASHDRTIRVWDAHTAEQIAAYYADAAVTSVAFSPRDPALLAAGDWMGHVLWLRLRL